MSDERAYLPTNGKWSMLPVHIRDSGALRRLRGQGAALSVYIAITLRTRWNRQALAEASFEQLAEDTGLGERQIGRAIRKLAELGLIHTVRTGRRNAGCSVFRPVTASQSDTGARLTEATAGHERSPDKVSAGHTGVHSRTSEGLQPDTQVSTGERQRSPYTETENRAAKGAAGLRPGEKETTRTLTDAGVSETMAGRLVEDGVDRDTAAAAVRMAIARRPQNLAGMVVRFLQERSIELVNAARVEGGRRVDAQKRKGAAQRLERDRAAIADIPPDRWLDVADAAEALLPEQCRSAARQEFARLGQDADLLSPIAVQAAAAAWFAQNAQAERQVAEPERTK